LKIKAVILDYGEVLCYPPTAEEWGRMASVFNLDPGEFRQLWDGPPGLRSWRYFLQGLLVDAHGRSQREDGSRAAAACRPVDLEMWATSTQRCGLGRADSFIGNKDRTGSNMPHEMIRYSRQNFSWLTHFDHLTFSAEVRLVKPETAIYRHSLDALESRPPMLCLWMTKK